MKYEVLIMPKADKDIKTLKRNEPQAYKKIMVLIEELQEHPETGTGHPERLKNETDIWSRRITKKHRLIYEIKEEVVTVLVFTAYGHYGDK